MRVQSFVVRRFVLGGMLAAGCAVASAQLHDGVPAPSTTHPHAQTAAVAAHLDIDTAVIAKPASAGMYGLMTEEINHAYEGGLYAELVSNNTFRGSWDGIQNWGVVEQGHAQVTMMEDRTDGPSAALPTSVAVKVDVASAGNEAGVSNPGYWGIAVRPHTTYKGSFYAKVDGDIGPLTARLVSDNTGAVLASATVALSAGGWARHEYTLTTGAVTMSATNHLELVVARPGTLHLQLVSLFPPTYNNQVNGDRGDLMEKMAAMHPHFIRLPGGNYLEGDRLADWYNWKKTIGPLVDRPGHMTPWTYWSTDGFGLQEFLNWTEDLHVEPVLAVYAGYALKGEHIKPGKDLEPFVQDALDEVEYVTGDASTKWGAERAKDGHAAPFPLHYIEIGNEDWFDKSGSYDERYAQFAEALRKKYPQYKLIATTPVKVKAGDEPDLIDDHYYKSPAEMFALVKHYDDAPRTGPKVFVGEWATRSGSPTPNFGDALGDAAWMTSMERNSDLIVMASYAPLLVNVSQGAMQWPTDLIGYDAGTSYGSPSYYAQCMFGAHMGDGQPESSITGVGERFFYSATVSSDTRVLHLKLVNAATVEQPLEISLKGLGAGAHVAKMVSLHGATFEATNSISAPLEIKPVESVVRFTGAKMRHAVPALTIEVVDVDLRGRRE
jgi:alpha-L-arabinofuranosidase